MIKTSTSHTLTILGFILATGIAAAQVGQVEMRGPVFTQGRDQPQRFGTGAIKGRVVDGASGAALPRARVRIMGPSGPRPAIMTDASGGFSFTNLPSGSYTLMVEKSTYLTIRHPSGGRTIRSGFRPLPVGDGEVLANVIVSMFRGASISGRVVDAHGDPVEFADVRLMRLSGTRPMMAGGNSTNDLGEFRLPRLQEGRYLLIVIPRRMSPDEGTDGPQLPQPLMTYYPGVAALDQAQPIVLEKAQAVSGLEVMLGEGIPAVVTGSVVTARGEVAVPGPSTNVFITARTLVKDMPGFFDGAGGTGIRPDGTFRMTLAPGEYRIEARLNQRSPDGTPPRPDSEEYGSVRLSVAPGASEAIAIVVGRGATATGRIVFEGTSPIPTMSGPSRLQFFAGEGPECRSGQAQVGADWTFRVEGLNGTCTASPPYGLGAWTLKAMLHEDQDLLDHPITFEPGQELRNLQVILTDKRTEISLRVADERGQPTREYAALMFPVSRSRRAIMRYVRPYVPPMPGQMSMPILTGRGGRGAGPPTVPDGPSTTRLLPPEVISGMPPGDYYVVAVDDLEVDAPRDLELMERLIPNAVRISLPDGGAAEAALKRVKLMGK